MRRVPSSPIENHALLGDGRSAALVDRDGTIDWLCWPRFDSPSLFASLLDADAGHYRIAPDEPARITRRYLPGTAVLETTFTTASGRVRVFDFFPVASETEKRRVLLPEHQLVRIVTGVEGAVPMTVEMRPRPGYGERRVRLRACPSHVIGDAGGALLSMSSDIPLGIADDGTAVRAGFLVRADESHAFDLCYSREAPAVLPDPARAAEALDRTLRWWRGFSSRLRWPSDAPHRELVERSAITLKLMIYSPSGAIIAAPTTSLPERAGGDLNWDYRYCWLRDAAFTTSALLLLGCDDDAEAFVSWLLHATALTLPELRVVYDVFGERTARERTLPLAGWRDSRPVRVGNDATEQRQLDLYGTVICAAGLLAKHGRPPDRKTRSVLRKLGQHVMKHWEKPDHGIWEVRGPLRHWTHSKAMCGIALDELAALRDGGMPGLAIDGLDATRARIRAAVESEAWSEARQSRVATFGGSSADAALLLLPLSGWEPADAPRSLATWEQIRSELEAGDRLLLRYAGDDSPGEGAFVACGFWAAEYLARAGARDEARRWFDASVACANDVGLFAEEVDAASGAALGNFPQAYSHVGLVRAAAALSPATRHTHEPAEAHP